MSSLHDGSNNYNPAPPMTALPPTQLIPAMLPGALPTVEGMMQVDGSWIHNAGGFAIGEQVTPARSDVAPGLLPPFGLREAAHLPTPQSPSNAAFFNATMNFPLGSPATQRTMPQSQQRQFPVVVDPSTVQNRIELQSSMSESQQFMTPESSPIYSRRTVRQQDQSSHLGNSAASLLSSPFIPRPMNQLGEYPSLPRSAKEPVMSALIEPRSVSPPLSRGMTPSSNLDSPFGGHRLSHNGRSHSMARTPARSHATTPIAAPPLPTQPVEGAPSQTPPPLSAPVPQRPLGGEIERIKAQLAVDQAVRVNETEARRPDYLVRAQRPGSGQIIEPLDLEEPAGHPGLGVTVTPMRGRRIQLFQETSEESFEQSLLAGGYPGYGSMAGSVPADPQTPVPNKPSSGLSQRALHWLQQATPGQPGPSNVPVESEEDWVPSEKEIRKRKRLAAFEEDKDSTELASRLHPVEVEGKGRVLITVPPEDLPPEVQATLQTPTKKRPNPRKRRRGHRRGRGGSPGDDDELDGPNWIDGNFPWCTRLQERKDVLRMAREERLKWIESYLDRDSDVTSEDEGLPINQALQPTLDSHDNDEVRPIRRGRGKMVPLKANPEARVLETRSRKSILIPSDPADARAALLSKRSVRALAERRRRRDEDEESSDEVNCPCGRGENGRPCVQCDDCKCWFHLRCMGIRSEAELGDYDDPWYCPDCLGVISSDPLSEPTFVPTDSELPRDGIHDPLLYQGSPRTPYTARRDPKTPTQTRQRSEVYDSRSSWNSSGAGPVTPLSTERDIGVYKTPVYDSPFNPADTPSRSKGSGPFGSPWLDSGGWRMTPGQRTIWKTGGIHELIGDAHRHVTLAAYNSTRSVGSLDDTPVLRNMSREDMSLVGRRLWGSPTTGSPSSSRRRSSLHDRASLTATPKGAKGHKAS